MIVLIDCATFFLLINFHVGVCFTPRFGEPSSTVCTPGSSTLCLVYLSPYFLQVSIIKILKIREKVKITLMVAFMIVYKLPLYTCVLMNVSVESVLQSG